MIGRLIAAAIFLGCVALFAYGASWPSYWGTGHEVLQAFGLGGGYERVNAAHRDTTYGQRTGPQVDNDPGS